MQERMSRRSLVAHTLAAFALTGSGLATAATPTQPATVTIQHAKGSTEVVRAPKRVVVFDLTSLDAMHTLGLPVAGVPKAQLPDYLSSYAAPRYTMAGSLFEPDYEALSHLRPDLIIVGGRSSAKYELLSKIAPTLDFSVRGSHMLEDMERAVTSLAGLYGKQEQGRTLMKQVRSEVDSLRPLASQAAPGVLLMAINEKIMPQAPGARFGFLFDVLGAQSLLAAKDVPARGGPAFGFDDLAKLQPQWIYVIDRNAATGSAPGGGAVIPSTQVFDNAQVRSTPAGQKNQVVFLDPKGWYLMGSSGPTAMLRNVAQLKQVYKAAAR
ncbi:siderophore ABC transporter substrate-binding protein [Comamonas composti]|uniref:siderophore ABC transporter substrate-binding protein n=1 Tax=Comamonas composti TaxID=408558 RepID=UPI00041D90EC|nr:siderophore ABC transporter substrate-binding protein [Comamonas composti]